MGSCHWSGTVSWELALMELLNCEFQHLLLYFNNSQAPTILQFISTWCALEWKQAKASHYFFSRLRSWTMLFFSCCSTMAPHTRNCLNQNILWLVLHNAFTEFWCINWKYIVATNLKVFIFCFWFNSTIKLVSTKRLNELEIRATYKIYHSCK